jgi:hypothetical protein
MCSDVVAPVLQGKRALPPERSLHAKPGAQRRCATGFERNPDDYDGLAFALVVSLGLPIYVTKAPKTHKHCTRCGETLPLGAFYADSRARDGHASRCKVCASQAAQEGYVQRGGFEHVQELRAKRS